MSAPMKNILFYKYVELSDLESLRDSLLDRAKALGLLGKILIASEGINGCVSGTSKAIEEYKEFVTALPAFADVAFKEGDAKDHTFNKIFVRIRKEIVTLRAGTKIENRAAYIEPADFKKLLDEQGEDVILIDARNDYESKIGRFSNAICPDIHIFSDWPKAVETFKDFKDKPIVTYCTGGIRCEKASAHLIEQGFTNVKQLHGGIIRYGQEVGDAHFEGKCFVFDKRGAIDIDPEKQSDDITQCEQCYIPCSTYYNCANVTCDRRVILCETCVDILESCCTKRCRGEHRVSDSLVNESRA